MMRNTMNASLLLFLSKSFRALGCISMGSVVGGAGGHQPMGIAGRLVVKITGFYFNRFIKNNELARYKNDNNSHRIYDHVIVIAVDCCRRVWFCCRMPAISQSRRKQFWYLR